MHLTQRTDSLLIAVTTGVCLGLLVSVRDSYITWILVGTAMLFSTTIVLIKVRDLVTYNNCAAFLLGLSVFPQAFWSKGIHLSISDVLLVVMFVWLMFVRKVRLPRAYIFYLFFYFGDILISFTWSTSVSSGIVPLVQLVEYLVVGVLVFYNLNSLSDVERAIRVYILFASAVGFLAIVLGVLHGLRGPLFVLGLQKNALGQIVGDALPLNLAAILSGWIERKNVRLYYLCFAVNLFALLLSFSRGAMMGTTVGIVIVLLFSRALRRPSIAFATAALCGAFGLLVNWYISINTTFDNQLSNISAGSSAYSRIIMWNDVMNKIRQSPYIGHGLGTYFISIPQLNFHQSDPNNIFLLNWHDLGLIGLILFSALVLYLIITAMKTVMQAGAGYRLLVVAVLAGFIAQVVHWQVDVSWVRGTSLYFSAMIALILKIQDVSKREKNQPRWELLRRKNL